MSLSVYLNSKPYTARQQSPNGARILESPSDPMLWGHLIDSNMCAEPPSGPWLHRGSLGWWDIRLPGIISLRAGSCGNSYR